MIFDSRSQPHGSPSLDGATIRHPKSRDWEPCKTCGERLEFSTNGMGKLIPECPVCDWGWRPSRDYEGYRVRRNATVVVEYERQEATYNAHGQLKRTCCCGRTYSPQSSGQRYCREACKRKADNERQKRTREAWDAKGLCTQCGKRPKAGAGAIKTCQRCLDMKRNKRHGTRGSESLRRYWQNKRTA